MSPRGAVLDADAAQGAVCGDRTLLAFELRELCRYGIGRVELRGAGASALAAEAARFPLPRTLSVTARAGDPEESVLHCAGGVPASANLARLLAPGGPASIAAEGATVSLARRGALGPPAPGARAVPEAGAFLRPALMLDRDGTLNEDLGYVGDRARWRWIEGAVEAVRDATEAGWHVFVVTNQSGIGRGFYDEAAFAALQGWVGDEVRRAGGTIDDVRFCPHHPDAGVGAYRRDCPWRKPAPGMLLDLVARWELDPARCAMIGDAARDLEAAAAAGIAGLRFGGGSLRDTVAAVLGGSAGR